MTVVETSPAERVADASNPIETAKQTVHPAFLEPHYDTPQQQFEAAKLGMWMFLGTEILLFGGLFCLYSVYRANHPDIFEYGAQFLSARWGALNTAVLIISSMTMATAVTAAQRGQERLLIALLLVTFLGGATFMSIKYIEYHHKLVHENLVWGASFYDKPEWVLASERLEAEESQAVALETTPTEPNLDHGRLLWTATCRSCHGAVGEGVTGQGKDLRGNDFVKSSPDADLIAFLKVGRLASDPLNTTGVSMPPKGGNPLLQDQDLKDIIGFVRTLEAPQGGAVAAISDAPAQPDEFFIPASSIPQAAAAPQGLALRQLGEPADIVGLIEYPHHSIDPDRPDNAHIFFNVYFLMTGLHGIHVLAGMGLILWLAIRTMLGHFSPAYFTPVDMIGLYWHVVDLIWIFLFPLLYLIR